MRRPDKHLLEAMRKLRDTPMPEGAEPLVFTDSVEARILGMVPYTPRPASTSSCRHDETALSCPHCDGPVDSRTRTCESCDQPVDAVRKCVSCGKDVTAFWPYRERVHTQSKVLA